MDMKLEVVVSPFPMSIERKRSTRNSAFDWISITRVTRIIGWYSSLLPVPKRRFISARGSRRRRRLRFKTCTLLFLISRKLALILSDRGMDVSEVFHFAGLLGPRVQVRIRNMGPTDRLPRSKIRTGTDGCCRKSRRDFPAANGSRSDQKRWT